MPPQGPISELMLLGAPPSQYPSSARSSRVSSLEARESRPPTATCSPPSSCSHSPSSSSDADAANRPSDTGKVCNPAQTVDMLCEGHESESVEVPALAGRIFGPSPGSLGCINPL